MKSNKTPQPGIKVLSVVSSLLRSLSATGLSLQFFPSDSSCSNHTGTVLHASHSLWLPWLSTSPWTSPNLVKIQLGHHKTHHSCHFHWPCGATHEPSPTPSQDFWPDHPLVSRNALAPSHGHESCLSSRCCCTLQEDLSGALKFTQPVFRRYRSNKLSYWVYPLAERRQGH